MSRFPAVQKTVNGTPVDQTRFKRVICEAFEGMQERSGRVVDLIPYVGAEWYDQKGRKTLNQTLANMAREGTLKSNPAKRGVYTLPAKFARTGHSIRDQNETSIIDSIRKRGGFAKFSEIMDDHGMRAHGEELSEFRAHRTRRQYGTETEGDQLSGVSDVRNSSDYRQFLDILRTSELIREDYFIENRKGETKTQGMYNLTQNELNLLVLRGKFAARIIKATHVELGRPDRRYIHRDAHFNAVGNVYQQARKSLGISRMNFAINPPVQAALLELSRIPEVALGLSEHFSDTTAAKVVEMREAGATRAEIADYRESRQNSSEGQRFLADVLLRFEMGGEAITEGSNATGVNAHLYAPISFYEVLAQELGIDPVAASRGFLAMDVRGERVRIRKDHPDADRRLKLQEDREAKRHENWTGRQKKTLTHYIDGVKQEDEDEG